MTPDVLTLTRALVCIPSPSGGEDAAAAYVAETMARFGFSDVRIDAWGSVIGLRRCLHRGRQIGPTLLFDGHMDVVAPGPEAWAHDPYGAEVSGGRLWGRGAADTKGSLAAMICAGAALPLDDLAGTLVVAATVCEENLTGAALGHVLDACPADLVITGEPTGLRLGVAQKGRATLRLRATGRSSHTSQPELGDNAAYKMIEAVGRLRALSLPADPELGPGVLELVELHSEPFPNQTLVPAECHARFVARIMPGETADAFLGRITVGLGDLTGVTCTLDTLRQTCYTGAVLEAVDFLPGWRCSTDDPRRVTLPGCTRRGRPSRRYLCRAVRHQRLRKRRPLRCGASQHPQLHLWPRRPGPGAHRRRVGRDLDLHAAQAGYAALAWQMLTPGSAPVFAHPCSPAAL